MQGQEAKGCTEGRVTYTQTKRILQVAEENKAVAIDNLTLLCQQGGKHATVGLLNLMST